MCLLETRRVDSNRFVYYLRILHFRYFHPTKPNIPVDCHCKSYVHPHTSTFDILSHNNGSPSLPHVSTIMEDKFVHYRAPVNVPPHGLQASCTETGDEYEGGALFSNNQNNCLIIQR